MLVFYSLRPPVDSPKLRTLLRPATNWRNWREAHIWRRAGPPSPSLTTNQCASRGSFWEAGRNCCGSEERNLEFSGQIQLLWDVEGFCGCIYTFLVPQDNNCLIVSIQLISYNNPVKDCMYTAVVLFYPRNTRHPVTVIIFDCPNWIRFKDSIGWKG